MLGFILRVSLVAVISCNGQTTGFKWKPGYNNDAFNRFNEFKRGFENFRPVSNTRSILPNSKTPSIPFENPGTRFPNPIDYVPISNLKSTFPSLTKFPGDEATSSVSESVQEFPQVILDKVASSGKAFQQLPETISGANPILTKNAIQKLNSTLSSWDDNALIKILKYIIAANTGKSIDNIFTESAIRKTEEQIQNILGSLTPSTKMAGSLNGLFGPQTQTFPDPVPFANNLNSHESSGPAPSAPSPMSSSSLVSTVSAA